MSMTRYSDFYDLHEVEELTMRTQTMHETYLWPFANAIRAGTASIMCSYQRLNGSYSCQNSKTLNGLLKNELGFQGYVVSDWLAVHAGVASIEAGLVSMAKIFNRRVYADLNLG